MIIDCISDLHGFEPKLPGGDLLIIAGDCTAGDKIIQWANFFHWLTAQQYRKKILIAGNHDNFFKSGFPKNQKEGDNLNEVEGFLDVNSDSDFEYLCDSGTEFEGLKIWGSPWTNWFHGVHPQCKAFMSNEEKLAKKCDLIPQDTDILITHGPAHGILDEISNKYGLELHVGSVSLRKTVEKVKPRLHVFGHIHEAYGEMLLKHEGTDTLCVNASYVNERYSPVNKPKRVELCI